MVKVRMIDTSETVEVSRSEAHALIETNRAVLPGTTEEEKPKAKKRYKHRMIKAEE